MRRAFESPPRWAMVGFLLGAVLQIGGLALRGTSDVVAFKAWAISSVDRGLVRSYTRPVDPLPSDPTAFTRPDYPPLTVVMLFAAGRAALVINPDMAIQSRVLTVLVKAPVFLVRLAVLLLVLGVAMRLVDDREQAWRIGLAHWLNPALILNGTTLGYLDPLCWGPGLVAVVCAATNRPALSGVLLAIAMLTKHQGAFFVLPVLACIHSRRDIGRVSAAFSAVAVLVFAPFILFGDPQQLHRALMVNLREDLLSGNALNVWWVVTAIAHMVDAGWRALEVPMDIVRVSSIVDVLGFNPRAVASAVVMAASLWAFSRARRSGSLAAAAALGAVSVHTYFVFAIAVHENHLVYSVSLAAIVMLYWREYWRVFVALSAMVTINLLVFYGLGRDFFQPHRVGAFLPVTVLLSLVNLVLLGTHWMAFLRRTATTGHPATPDQA